MASFSLVTYGLSGNPSCIKKVGNMVIWKITAWQDCAILKSKVNMCDVCGLGSHVLHYLQNEKRASSDLM
jgi:hypothetical protein